MTTVRQLLDQKGGNTWSIHPDATVFDAVAKMAEKDIGSLVVMEGEELVGIITERHYARNVVLKGKASPATPVRDIMERHVVIAQPEQSVDQCMAVMSEKRGSQGVPPSFCSIGAILPSRPAHRKCPSRTAAVKDGPSSDHRVGGAQRP